jgi:hypothetical protein
MSFLVNELGTLIYRVLVLSDTPEALKEVFQDLSMELTTDLSSEKQDLEWRACVFSQDSVFPYFCAATLGWRGKLKCRIHFVGHSVDTGEEVFEICEAADAVLLDVHPEKQSSALFISKIRQNLTRPCVLRGLKGATVLPSDELRAKALRKWAEDKLSKLLLVRENEKLLQKSLEWALSFS